jgi:hypothetical protein
MMTFFAPAARCFSAVEGEKESRRFDHDVGADLVPLELGRILDGGEADLLAVDHQRAAVDGDVALEAAVH